MRKQAANRRFLAGWILFSFTLTLLFPYPSFALRPLSPRNSAPVERQIERELLPAGAGLEEPPAQDLQAFLEGLKPAQKRMWEFLTAAPGTPISFAETDPDTGQELTFTLRALGLNEGSVRKSVRLLAGNPRTIHAYWDHLTGSEGTPVVIPEFDESEKKVGEYPLRALGLNKGSVRKSVRLLVGNPRTIHAYWDHLTGSEGTPVVIPEFDESWKKVGEYTLLALGLEKGSVRKSVQLLWRNPRTIHRTFSYLSNHWPRWRLKLKKTGHYLAHSLWHNYLPRVFYLSVMESRLGSKGIPLPKDLNLKQVHQPLIEMRRRFRDRVLKSVGAIDVSDWVGLANTEGAFQAGWPLLLAIHREVREGGTSWDQDWPRLMRQKLEGQGAPRSWADPAGKRFRVYRLLTDPEHEWIRDYFFDSQGRLKDPAYQSLEVPFPEFPPLTEMEWEEPTHAGLEEPVEYDRLDPNRSVERKPSWTEWFFKKFHRFLPMLGFKPNLPTAMELQLPGETAPSRFVAVGKPGIRILWSRLFEMGRSGILVVNANKLERMGSRFRFRVEQGNQFSRLRASTELDVDLRYYAFIDRISPFTSTARRYRVSAISGGHFLQDYSFVKDFNGVVVAPHPAQGVLYVQWIGPNSTDDLLMQVVQGLHVGLKREAIAALALRSYPSDIERLRVWDVFMRLLNNREWYDAHPTTRLDLVRFLLQMPADPLRWRNLQFLLEVRQAQLGRLPSLDPNVRKEMVLLSRAVEELGSRWMGGGAGAGLEEVSPDHFAWEVLPGTEVKVFFAPEGLLEVLRKSPEATPEALTVGVYEASEKPTLVSEAFHRLGEQVPAFSRLNQEQRDDLAWRLLTPNHILISRSIPPDRLRQLLEHEWPQRLVNSDPQVRQKIGQGVDALKKIGHPLLGRLYFTPYEVRWLSAAEFAGQWCRLASVDIDRQEWRRLKRSLRQQVRRKDPGIPPEVREAVKILDFKIAPHALKEVNRILPLISDRWAQMPRFGEMEIRPSLIRKPTLEEEYQRAAAVSVERRVPVAQDPALIEVTRELAMTVVSRLAGEKGVTPDQFIEWFNRQDRLEIVDSKEDTVEENVQTLSQESLKGPWPFEPGRFSVVRSVFTFNEFRVPEGMAPAAYYDHVCVELMRVLRPGGLTILVTGAGGNDELKKDLERNGLLVNMPLQNVYLATRQSLDFVLDRIQQEIAQRPQAGIEEEEAGTSGGIPVYVLELKRLFWIRKGMLPPSDSTTRDFLRLIFDHPDLFRGKRVLEVGTGSGALAVALARVGVEKVVAVDLLPEVVANARENIDEERKEIQDRIILGLSNVYRNLPEVTGPTPQFDVVIFNNPIQDDEPNPEEPETYITRSGKDFRVVRETIAGLPELLRPGGSAYMIATGEPGWGRDLWDYARLRQAVETMTAGPERWTVESMQSDPKSRSIISIYRIEQPAGGLEESFAKRLEISVEPIGKRSAFALGDILETKILELKEWSEAVKNSIDAYARMADENQHSVSGPITATVRRIPGGWVLELSDEGHGIPENILRDMFHLPWPGGYRKDNEIYLGGKGDAFSGGQLGDSSMVLRGGRIEVDTRDERTGAHHLIFDPQTRSSEIKPGDRTSLGTTIRWVFSSGLEKSGTGAEERMTAMEFSQKYGDWLLVPEQQKGHVESWLKRGDVLAVVIDLPLQLPLYVKGDRLFWKIIDDFLPRVGEEPEFRKVHLVPILLPTSQWSDLGLILRDPLFDLSESDNPRRLRVLDVDPDEPEAVPALKFIDLLLGIFQSRIGVPESERLGAFVFTDPAGQAHLVLFHSA